MARKTEEVDLDVANLQPDELKALKATVDEFMNRLESLENEMETLKDDRKVLIEEFKEKLDMKTLQACLRVLKIKRTVEHKGTFDALMEVLQDPAEK